MDYYNIFIRWEFTYIYQTGKFEILSVYSLLIFYTLGFATYNYLYEVVFRIHSEKEKYIWEEIDHMKSRI